MQNDSKKLHRTGKNELLSIINNHKHVIENKRTNASSMDLKNKAWEEITREFNASAEHPRSAKQLQTAYLNLKRLTRKNVADENMQMYIEYKKYKKIDSEDKKEIKATGGGKYAPKLTEVGAQMLAIMGDQVIPLSNTCDSAAAYYGQDEIQIAETQPVPDAAIAFTYTFQDDETISNSAAPIQKENNENEPCQSANTLKTKPILKKSKVHTKKKPLNISTTTLKKKFYEKKNVCALIEKNTNIINYRVAKKKEELIDLNIKVKKIEYMIKLRELENITHIE